MRLQSVVVAGLILPTLCWGNPPGSSATNVTGYVVSVGVCETTIVDDGKTTKETVPLTTLELAEKQPVAEAFSNRPHVWKRNGKEITLYNYKFTGKMGALLNVTIVPTNALDNQVSYTVVTEPGKSSKK